MGIADEFWVVACYSVLSSFASAVVVLHVMFALFSVFEVVQVLESGGLPGQRWVACS